MNHDYYYYNLLNKFGKVACFVYKLLHNFLLLDQENIGCARKKKDSGIYLPPFSEIQDGCTLA